MASEKQTPKIGDLWWVKINEIPEAKKIHIFDLTNQIVTTSFVVLDNYPDVLAFQAHQSYRLTDINWVEKIGEIPCEN